MTPRRRDRAPRLGVALWCLLASAAVAQTKVALTAGGLVLDKARERRPALFSGRSFQVLEGGTTCVAVDPATGAETGPVRTLPSPPGAVVAPLVLPDAEGQDAAVLAWLGVNRVFWLRTTCAATDATAASEVSLPALPAGASYGWTGAGAVLPDGRLALDVQRHLVLIDRQAGTLEVLSSLDDWRARFIPPAEQQLLHGFGVKAVVATQASELWVLLQRNSASSNAVMDLWVLRKAANASGWDELFAEHASSASAQRLQLIPTTLPAPVMLKVPGEPAVLFLTRTHWEGAFAAVFADTRAGRPFGTLPRAAWLHDRGLAPLRPGTDHLWTLSSPPGTVSTSLRAAPLSASEPDGDVDRDGLPRQQELALGTSNFSWDSDFDTVPDAIEVWRSGAPADPAVPGPAPKPETTQLALSTRALDWNRFGEPFHPHTIVPGGFCLGNEALGKLCPRWTNRCSYEGYLCYGADDARIGPDDAPFAGHVAFLPGTKDAWFRRRAGGAWGLERSDGGVEPLPGLELATADTWAIAAAVSEEELWLWRPDDEVLQWRRGAIAARTSAVGAVVLGYSQALGTMLLSRLWPGEEQAVGADAEWYLFAVDASAPGGQRPLGSLRQWGTQKATWFRTARDAPLHVLGFEQGSQSLDAWWRPVERHALSSAPLFGWDWFRNGPAAYVSLVFLGAPAEFMPGDCPIWADPTTCGSLSRTNLPTPRYWPLPGELLPVPARVLPGDVALWVTAVLGTSKAAAGDDEGLWLHREHGGVHPWLTATQWRARATPSALASLQQAPSLGATSVAFSADRSRLCVVARDGRLFEWQLVDGEARQVELLRESGVKACGYDAAGARVVATDARVEREGAAPIELGGGRVTLGVHLADGALVVHEADADGLGSARCFGLGGEPRGGRASVAALTVARGVVTWAEALNTLDQVPLVGSLGHAWAGTLDDFCGGQPREHVAAAGGQAAESFWHRLHALGAMLAPGEQLEVLHGVLARRPDGVLLASAVGPRTRARGTGSFGGEYLYALPHRVTPSAQALPGAEPLPQHEGQRRGAALFAPIHPRLADVTALALAPGETAADYGQASRYDCWNGGCVVPEPPTPAPDGGPPPGEEPPTTGEPVSPGCGCSGVGAGGAELLALAWVLRRFARGRGQRGRHGEARKYHRALRRAGGTAP